MQRCESKGGRVSRVRDPVRESSRSLLEEFEDPSDLLERPTGKNSTADLDGGRLMSSGGREMLQHKFVSSRLVKFTVKLTESLVDFTWPLVKFTRALVNFTRPVLNATKALVRFAEPLVKSTKPCTKRKNGNSEIR